MTVEGENEKKVTLFDSLLMFKKLDPLSFLLLLVVHNVEHRS